MNSTPLMQTMIWTCGSCGFAIEGKAPHMECPVCEAYKSSFVDIPQHVEVAVRDAFGADNANSAEARRDRLARLREGGYIRSARLRGRRPKAVHGSGHSRTDR